MSGFKTGFMAKILVFSRGKLLMVEYTASSRFNDVVQRIRSVIEQRQTTKCDPVSVWVFSRPSLDAATAGT